MIMDCMISGTGPCKQLIQCSLIFWVKGINHLVLTSKKSKQNKFDIKIIYLPIFGKTWNLGHWTHCWHQIESDTKYCTNITRVAPGSHSKNLAYTIHTNQLPWIQYHTPSTQTSYHGYNIIHHPHNQFPWIHYPNKQVVTDTPTMETSHHTVHPVSIHSDLQTNTHEPWSTHITHRQISLTLLYQTFTTTFRISASVSDLGTDLRHHRLTYLRETLADRYISYT